MMAFKMNVRAERPMEKKMMVFTGSLLSISASICLVHCKSALWAYLWRDGGTKWCWLQIWDHWKALFLYLNCSVLLNWPTPYLTQSILKSGSVMWHCFPTCNLFAILLLDLFLTREDVSDMCVHEKANKCVHCTAGDISISSPIWHGFVWKEFTPKTNRWLEIPIFFGGA